MTTELKYKNIVFEGMDGSTKHTQAIQLLRRIRSKTMDEAKLWSFPNYDNSSGMLVREYLRNKEQIVSSFEQIKKDSLLYTLNRFETLSNEGYFFRSEEERAAYNLFDRYTTSNMLYQSLDLPDILTAQYISWLKDIEFNMLKLPKPDIVFALRVSPELSEANIKKRGLETDYFESLEVQRKVRLNLDYVARHEGWIVIDVDQKGQMRSVSDIHDEIFSHLIK